MRERALGACHCSYPLGVWRSILRKDYEDFTLVVASISHHLVICLRATGHKQSPQAHKCAAAQQGAATRHITIL